MEPEAREVARGHRYVEQQAEPRATLAPSPHHRLERDPLVGQVAPQRVGHADPTHAIDPLATGAVRHAGGGRGAGWRPRARASRARERSSRRRSGVARRPLLVVGARGGQAVLALEQRAQQVGQRGDDVVGLGLDGLERGPRRRPPRAGPRRARRTPRSVRSSGSSSAPLSGATPPGSKRARAPDPQLVGMAAHRLLELVLAAREHELGAEHRQPQPLGLAVEVRRGADCVLLEEAAQVDRLGLVVGVPVVVVGLALQRPRRSAARSGRRCRPRAGAAASGAGPGRRSLTEPEVEVEQPLEGLGVVGALDRASPAARRAPPRGRRGPRARPRSSASRPSAVDTRTPVLAQQPDEVDRGRGPRRAPQWSCAAACRGVGVRAGARRRVAVRARARCSRTFVRVAVVLDHHAERLLDQLGREARRARARPAPAPSRASRRCSAPCAARARACRWIVRHELRGQPVGRSRAP